MRTAIIALAAIASVTFASASFAGLRIEPAAPQSAVQFVDAKKKQRAPMSVGSFKANVGRTKDAGHTGCTHGNDGIDHCTQYCIESASGSMCVDDVACYYRGEQVPCPK